MQQPAGATGQPGGGGGGGGPFEGKLGTKAKVGPALALPLPLRLDERGEGVRRRRLERRETHISLLRICPSAIKVGEPKRITT